MQHDFSVRFQHHSLSCSRMPTIPYISIMEWVPFHARSTKCTRYSLLLHHQRVSGGHTVATPIRPFLVNERLVGAPCGASKSLSKGAFGGGVYTCCLQAQCKTCTQNAKSESNSGASPFSLLQPPQKKCEKKVEKTKERRKPFLHVPYQDIAALRPTVCAAFFPQHFLEKASDGRAMTATLPLAVFSLLLNLSLFFWILIKKSCTSIFLFLEPHMSYV